MIVSSTPRFQMVSLLGGGQLVLAGGSRPKDRKMLRCRVNARQPLLQPMICAIPNSMTRTSRPSCSPSQNRAAWERPRPSLRCRNRPYRRRSPISSTRWGCGCSIAARRCRAHPLRRRAPALRDRRVRRPQAGRERAAIPGRPDGRRIVDRQHRATRRQCPTCRRSPNRA
jgi:hypothetical protein